MSIISRRSGRKIEPFFIDLSGDTVFLLSFECVVVPFIGVVKARIFGSEGPGKVAIDLQKILNDMAEQGWDYVRVENFDIQQTVGSLASLLGNEP